MSEQTATRKINLIEEVYEDGVLVRGRKTSQLPKEPHFVKLYLKDLAHMRELPGWVSGILYELLKKMDYTNEIVLNSTVKNRIAEELGINPKTIDNALVKFVDKKILFRQGKGVYQANPYIFGRGSWHDVEEIRMSVSYKPNGEKEIHSEIVEQAQLDHERLLAEMTLEEKMLNASSCLKESLELELEGAEQRTGRH
jgi:hypothetical protein